MLLINTLKQLPSSILFMCQEFERSRATTVRTSRKKISQYHVYVHLLHAPCPIRLLRQKVSPGTLHYSVFAHVLYLGSLPTPSPELTPPHHHTHHSPLHDDLFIHNQLPPWDGLRSDSNAVHVSAGSKRSHDNDYSVDDFFNDMKKRRVNPSYDPGTLLLIFNGLNSIEGFYQAWSNVSIIWPTIILTPMRLSILVLSR